MEMAERKKKKKKKKKKGLVVDNVKLLVKFGISSGFVR